MKKIILILTLAAVTLLGWHSEAQIYDTNGAYVQTFAGSGFSGYVDGVGQSTMFNNPNAIVADSHSNLFVWDSNNSRIRKIAPDGTVSTFAGGGNQTTGLGTNASLSTSLYSFGGMTIDHSNALWLTASPIGSAGGTGYLIRIGSDGYVSRTNNLHYTYSVNGGFQLVSGVCVDSANNIYYSDYLGNKIYQYQQSNGISTVFAGSGNTGSLDGFGIFTSFYQPATLACDQADNIYVWDSGNQIIRRIDKNQNVTTISGKSGVTANVDGVTTNAFFYLLHFNTYATYIMQMCLDSSGNLFLACGNSIRKIDATTNVVTLAGSFSQTGFTNGAGNLARFNGANGVCVSGGTIYVADSGNQRIRSITNNPAPQIVSGANLDICTFAGVTITGTVGRTYQIQSSPDLSGWITRATILLTASPYLWIDQNPVSGNKFYRAFLLP